MEESMVFPRRTAAAVLAVVLALAATGCRSNRVGRYLLYRAEDCADMADVGITFSLKPCISAYACGVSVVTGGYSKFDGWFAGVGGGRVGVMRHYNYCFGLLIAGREEIGFGTFNKEEPETLWTHNQGIAGVFMPPFDASPAYVPACTHFLHLAFVGAVGNLRYMEMVDFVLGWAGVDIANDDGRKFGYYPWNKGRDEYGDWDDWRGLDDWDDWEDSDDWKDSDDWDDDW
jgi:hypothetical protein